MGALEIVLWVVLFVLLLAFGIITTGRPRGVDGPRRVRKSLCDEMVERHGLDGFTDYGLTLVQADERSGHRVYPAYVCKILMDGKTHWLAVDERDVVLSPYPAGFIRQKIARFIEEKRGR